MKKSYKSQGYIFPILGINRRKFKIKWQIGYIGWLLNSCLTLSALQLGNGGIIVDQIHEGVFCKGGLRRVVSLSGILQSHLTSSSRVW